MTLQRFALMCITSGCGSMVATLLISPGSSWWGSAGSWILGLILLAIDWWRRKGRKRAAKAWGRVKDLGHRLVVTPEPAPL